MEQEGRDPSTALLVTLLRLSLTTQSRVRQACP